MFAADGITGGCEEGGGAIASKAAVYCAAAEIADGGEVRDGVWADATGCVAAAADDGEAAVGDAFAYFWVDVWVRDEFCGVGCSAGEFDDFEGAVEGFVGVGAAVGDIGGEGEVFDLGLLAVGFMGDEDAGGGDGEDFSAFHFGCMDGGPWRWGPLIYYRCVSCFHRSRRAMTLSRSSLPHHRLS